LGRVCLEDHGAKVTLQYQGVVAADGKSVQLTVMLGEGQPGSRQRGHTVRVPDGGTLLLDATQELRPWADAQAHGEDVPMLSRIPYLSRLSYSPPQRQIDRILLLVTPRVAVSKPEESVVSAPRQIP
jgi:hypothetical protein